MWTLVHPTCPVRCPCRMYCVITCNIAFLGLYVCYESKAYGDGGRELCVLDRVDTWDDARRTWHADGARPRVRPGTRNRHCGATRGRVHTQIRRSVPAPTAVSKHRPRPARWSY
eukprot:4709462-Prymnesium_polylepis.1